MKKIALLSNINMNYSIRMLKQKSVNIFQPEGYGNEIGDMLNPESAYTRFEADVTFLIMDLMELINHDMDGAELAIGQWFERVLHAVNPNRIYYISNSYLYGTELYINEDWERKNRIESIWDGRLSNVVKDNPNIRVFRYKELIQELGVQNAFSRKMWYMGNILLSNAAQNELCARIRYDLELESRTPKKVLVLDLDNTLWGGLAGENDHTPICLSDDHIGLAYKNGQRILKEMKKCGVILTIVSKNNEKDAMDIIEQHTHMVLRKQDFAAYRVNWNQKPENIRELSRELNLGLDSFVFWDDSAAERELVREMLPEVTVPEFPTQPEGIEFELIKIYRDYFAKSVITSEDKAKTAQYLANTKRREMKESAVSFERYLQDLELQIVREDPKQYVERMTQLINKTNQFNLTTMRMEQTEVHKRLQSASGRVFLYRVLDRFGDNGITAVVMTELEDGIPVIKEFVMSCRIMGKWIENAILENVEDEWIAEGYQKIQGLYIPTDRNQPVEDFYDRLGYKVVERSDDGTKKYEINLQMRPIRKWYGERKDQRDE